ncbi:MAG TPA: PP2C family protein-serine/threonine phosphatase, partial [Candidatus Ozemobacteraceae bacterium]|nr:PP2C family protein-serine/threonine phosphatase [Candidatus Ozemobacteraceae bacterium]
PETLTHDELADLSESFNTTLEKLQELSVARTLQESLFPVAAVRIGAYEVFGKSVAATELGGDYFDYFSVGDHQVMLLIGDVAGHGTGSALQMAMAKTGMHFAVQIDPSPARVCERLNQMILSCMRKKQMMTFFCALVDTQSGVVRYANAGHNNPMLIRVDGTIEEMGSGGYPLGVRKTVSYGEKELQVNPGDRIWCYTDGLPECRDAHDQDLGYDRLKAILRSASAETALDTCDQVLRHCHDYRKGAPQGDDMTLILLKRS